LERWLVQGMRHWRPSAKVKVHRDARSTGFFLDMEISGNLIWEARREVRESAWHSCLPGEYAECVLVCQDKRRLRRQRRVRRLRIRRGGVWSWGGGDTEARKEKPAP